MPQACSRRGASGAVVLATRVPVCGLVFVVVASGVVGWPETTVGLSMAPVVSPAGEREQASVSTPDDETQRRREWTQGRLLARPHDTGGPGARSDEAHSSAEPGLRPLNIVADRDVMLYVPARYQPGHPAPLIVMLHGAGGDATGGLAPLLWLADEAGALLLAPAARHTTWDVIVTAFGADVGVLDRALARVFAEFAVDPGHLAVGGFSDGASYALSLGLTNGNLFSHILAFSPGFMSPGARRGQPRIYIAHGTADTVLPIDACSRRIVPRLRSEGYDVRYHEFAGPHIVLPDIAREGLDWFLTTAA